MSLSTAMMMVSASVASVGFSGSEGLPRGRHGLTDIRAAAVRLKLVVLTFNRPYFNASKDVSNYLLLH